MTMWNPNKKWDEFEHDEEDFYYKTVMNADGESVTEEVPIESKGYEILKEDVIKCADCGKKLVDVIKVKEDALQKKVVTAYCPCGGSSFIYEIDGHTYLQASEGRAIEDMPTEIVDGVVHLDIKVI